MLYMIHYEIITHYDTLKNKVDPKNIWKSKNKQPQPLSQKMQHIALHRTAQPKSTPQPHIAN